MSSVRTNIRGLFDPPDPRSEREIDDDLDAEFAFHIEQLEAELIEQGVPPEHAPRAPSHSAACAPVARKSRRFIAVLTVSPWWIAAPSCCAGRQCYRFT
jgi:hypothetical protein